MSDDLELNAVTRALGEKLGFDNSSEFLRGLARTAVDAYRDEEERINRVIGERR